MKDLKEYLINESVRLSNKILKDIMNDIANDKELQEIFKEDEDFYKDAYNEEGIKQIISSIKYCQRHGNDYGDTFDELFQNNDIQVHDGDYDTADKVFGRLEDIFYKYDVYLNSI